MLLTYSVKEGWEPLCKFLGVPVPDVEFPHKNKKGGINRDMLANHSLVVHMRNEAAVSASLFVAATGYLIYIITTTSTFEESLLGLPSKIFDSLLSYWG